MHPECQGDREDWRHFSQRQLQLPERLRQAECGDVLFGVVAVAACQTRWAGQNALLLVETDRIWRQTRRIRGLSDVHVDPPSATFDLGVAPRSMLTGSNKERNSGGDACRMKGSILDG